MSEKRFEVLFYGDVINCVRDETGKEYNLQELINLLMDQQATISKLEEEKDYWKSKAMTLLMQVRRLTSRMTDKEVKEFNKELEE